MTARRSRTFPPSQQPAEEGVYERRYPGQGWWYCLWRNGVWFQGLRDPKAASDCVWVSARQSLPWRGLARKPS